MQKEPEQNRKIPKQYKYLGLITALYIISSLFLILLLEKLFS